MKVFKSTKNAGFRLSAPPPAEAADWTEVDAETLPADQRVALRIDQIGEDFAAKMKSLEREVDTLKSKLLVTAAPGAVQTEGVKPISLCRLFKAMATKDWTGAEYEREAVTSPRARVLAASTDAAGGYIVPAEYMADQFIPLLRSNTVLDKVRARFLTGLTGAPVRLPKQSSGATAYWVAENAVITDSTQGTSMLELRPRKVAALTKVSNELIAEANPSAEALVREDLAAVLARALDLAAFKGTGASGQPLGINGQTSLNTSSATAGTISTIFDMIKENEVDNVDMTGPSCAVVAHPTAWNVLRKNASAAGYPKPYEGAGYVIPDAVVGLPVFKSSQLGTNDVFVGKFDDLIVAMWAGFSFRASQDAGDAFAYDQTWMRATMLVDIGVRYAQSFCLNTVFGT